jgi:hypothetical protein
VEQYGSGPFNRAMLMNVGAAEALKQYDYQGSILQNSISADNNNFYYSNFGKISTQKPQMYIYANIVDNKIEFKAL